MDPPNPSDPLHGVSGRRVSRKFNALADEHQKILQYAAEAASADMSWKAQHRYSNDLIALKKEHGVRVHRTSDAIMDAQLKAWDVVLKPFMEDAYFAKVVESQKAWAKRVGAASGPTGP